MDIEPRCDGVDAGDFLEWRSPFNPAAAAVIGNPPFGRRGDLAAEFVNRALGMAGVVGMILPLCFSRYDGQRRIDHSARLVLSERLSPRSFVLPGDEGYRVGAVFQVWASDGAGPDLRQTRPLPTSHPDFDLWQYNNTRAAERYFSEPFKFAVPCQGYQDYSRRESCPDRCERTKQWMLILPHTQGSSDVLFNGIDYEALATSAQTATPGFRKGTLIAEYERVSS